MRLLIVEDHPGFREALSEGLSAIGFVIAAACASGEEALAALEDASPDAAIVDLGLVGMSGTKTIRALRAIRPELPVLVLTVFEKPAAIVGAIEAGAQGYLLKGVRIEEIAEALKQVSTGLSPISPAVARHLLKTMRERAQGPSPSPLTAREQEVLDLLIRGHSYPSTAMALSISFNTVQSHVRNIYKKLEVSTKAEAAYIALKEGWVKE